MAIANSLAVLLYLGCSVILIRNFMQRNQHDFVSFPIETMIVLALIFHGSDIVFTMSGGWNLGLFSTLSIAAWLMGFITLILGAKQKQAHPGMIIYPLVALCLVLNTLLTKQHITILNNPALEWHILLSLGAYSLFCLSALQALVLAIQEQRLRQRHFAGLIRKLPPIQSMETTLFHLISASFILLTLGLITGIFFIEDIFTQHLIHKTVLSLFAWCVFATLLWGRLRYGWRGKTAIKWTLIGFIFLVLAYFGSKFVLEFLITHG